MFEERSLRSGRGASAFHHQSGAVRPTVRPTRHRLCHHVGSAGKVCFCVCVHVLTFVCIVRVQIYVIGRHGRKELNVSKTDVE